MKLLFVIVMVCLSPALSEKERGSTREVACEEDIYSGMNTREERHVFLSPYNHDAASNSYGISSRMMKLKYYC